MDVKLPALLENSDRETHKPTDGRTGSKECLTCNNEQQERILTHVSASVSLLDVEHLFNPPL